MKVRMCIIVQVCEWEARKCAGGKRESVRVGSAEVCGWEARKCAGGKRESVWKCECVSLKVPKYLRAQMRRRVVRLVRVIRVIKVMRLLAY